MKAALAVFGYTVAVAWTVPVLLGRLTRDGISPRLGLAAWLTAMATVAARRTGRRALAAALLAMGTGTAVPAMALAATAGPVTARVHRLLDPPRPGRHARYGLAQAAVTLLLAGLPVLVTAIAGHLVPPA